MWLVDCRRLQPSGRATAEFSWTLPSSPVTYRNQTNGSLRVSEELVVGTRQRGFPPPDILPLPTAGHPPCPSRRWVLPLTPRDV